MNFSDFFQRFKSRFGHDRSSASKLPQKPLTPREIEELHAKIYPETHRGFTWTPKLTFDPQEWHLPFQPPLNEGTFAALNHHKYNQHQSLLFKKLPPELRAEIWSLAMGSQKLYITEQQEHKRRWAQADEIADFGWWRKKGLLNVPLVCRASYVESSGFLYSCNTFCIGFGHQERIELGWHFVEGLSNYFEYRHGAWDLCVTICYPDLENTWYDACAELQKLPKLKYLRMVVWISGRERAAIASRERELLAPLRELGYLIEIQVFLPWKQVNTELWEDQRFTISRKFEDRDRFGVTLPLLDQSK